MQYSNFILKQYYINFFKRMLQSLMKPTPTNHSPPRSPTRRNTSTVAELSELESEIILKKPKNVTQFIRDWANSRLNKMSLSKNVFEDSEDDQDFQFSLSKGLRAERRFALRVDNSEFEGELQQIPRNQKLQETKSIILIKLKSMEILKDLTNEMLWEMVQDFQEIQYRNDFKIIQKKEPIRNFYIIISGSVMKKQLNKKATFLSDGDEFGLESIYFGNASSCDYISQGLSRIAHLEGRRVSKFIRDNNISRYKIICKAIQNIQYFKTLHADEVDKIAEIAMNQPSMTTEPQQEVSMDIFGSSFLIVTKGIYYGYSRRLTQENRKDHTREFRAGESFGIQCLRKEKCTQSIVSQDYGTIIEVKCSDIQRSIGALFKLQKRRRKR